MLTMELEAKIDLELERWGRVLSLGYDLTPAAKYALEQLFDLAIESKLLSIEQIQDKILWQWNTIHPGTRCWLVFSREGNPALPAVMKRAPVCPPS